MQLFLDYTLFLLVDGSIALDEEIKPEQLMIADGDRFVASVIDGKIMLKKIVNKKPTLWVGLNIKIQN